MPYVANKLNILNMAYVSGKLLKYIKNASLCWKWLKSLRKDLNISEMAKIFGKWLKYVKKG